jgi:hypothetical protein
VFEVNIDRRQPIRRSIVAFCSEGLALKNIMVVDGAENCVYDIFATPDDDFTLIFPQGTDIAFIEDIERRADAELVFEALKRTWSKLIVRNSDETQRGMLNRI